MILFEFTVRSSNEVKSLALKLHRILAGEMPFQVVTPRRILDPKGWDPSKDIGRKDENEIAEMKKKLQSMPQTKEEILNFLQSR